MRNMRAHQLEVARIFFHFQRNLDLAWSHHPVIQLQSSKSLAFVVMLASQSMFKDYSTLLSNICQYKIRYVAYVSQNHLGSAKWLWKKRVFLRSGTPWKHFARRPSCTDCSCAPWPRAAAEAKRLSGQWTDYNTLGLCMCIWVCVCVGGYFN